MGNIASLDMISKRGGFEVDDLIQKINAEIERKANDFTNRK
jgi:hypothetical protein